MGFLLLAFAGFVAGFIGVNVGGGGLITIPCLIFLGLPAQAAIGTDKLAMLGGSGVGLYKFHREGKIDYGLAVRVALIGTVGSYIGANTVLAVPEQVLKPLVGIFILAILGVTFLMKDSGLMQRESIPPLTRVFGYILCLLVGFWSGFFGGGYATLGLYVMIYCFGKTFIQGAASLKIMGFCAALISIAVFGLSGVVYWTHGLVLLVSTGVGAYFGVHYAIKKGERWMRGLFAVVVVLFALKLLLPS